MPRLTIENVNKLLSPVLLPNDFVLPGVDGERKELEKGKVPIIPKSKEHLRFEDARMIKEAIKRAIHGPGTVDDLMDEVIVYFHEITPHGKRAETIAKALDERRIPNPYGKDSWSKALKNDGLRGTIRSFFSTRYTRATQPQN